MVALNFDCSLEDLAAISDEIFVVLDKQGRTVYLDPKAKSLLGITATDMALDRLGNLVRCERTQFHRGQCGKLNPCEFCGINRAINKSCGLGLNADEDANLVCFVNKKRLHFDLRVKARPIKSGCLSGFVLLSLSDAWHLGRNAVYERELNPYVQNHLCSLLGAVGHLASDDADMSECLKAEMHHSIVAMLSYVRKTELVSMVQQGTIHTSVWPVLVKDIVACYENQKLNQNLERIRIENRCNSSAAAVAPSDLLTKAIDELLANALHADLSNQVVLRFSCTDDEIWVTVANKAVLEPAVKWGIYRPMPSKNNRLIRGYGTYLARMLVEKYCNGRIRFKTDSSYGTVFNIVLPRSK